MLTYAAGNGIHAVPSLAISSVMLSSPFLLHTPCAALVRVDLSSGRISLQAPDAPPNFTASACSTHSPPTSHYASHPVVAASATRAHVSTSLRAALMGGPEHAMGSGPQDNIPVTQMCGLGELASCHRVHGPGFAAHPALVDCSLHIGASMAASQSQGLPNVPVGLGSFMALAEPRAATRSMWACASLEGPSQSNVGPPVGQQKIMQGGQSSGYKIHEDGCHRAGLLCMGLVSKPMRGLPAGQAATAVAGASHTAGGSSALYNVTWLVASAQEPSTPSALSLSYQRPSTRDPPSRGPIWVMGDQGMSPPKALQTSRGPLSHSCGQGLAVLQRAIREQQASGTAIHLVTDTGPHDGSSIHGRAQSASQGRQAAVIGREAAAAGAAAGGLLRVAASENPSMRFAASEIETASRVNGHLEADQDAFGARTAGRARQLPRLAQAEDMTYLQRDQDMGMTPSFVVTGGLGGVFRMQTEDRPLLCLICCC